MFTFKTTKEVAIAGIIAALYVIITISFGAFSYGPIQVRFAAGLCTLASVFPFLILPLGVGTALANLFGGYGLWDIAGGAIATMAASYGCYLLRRWRWVMPLAIPIISAAILAGYLHILFGLPFLVTMIYIAIGQTIAAYTVGLGVLKAADIYYDKV